MASTTEPKVAEPEQSTPNEQQKPEQKHLALGEDDEFEDFPVDGTLPPPLLSSLLWPLSKHSNLPFSPFSLEANTKESKTKNSHANPSHLLSSPNRLARRPNRSRPAQRRNQAPMGGELGRRRHKRRLFESAQGRA